MLTSLLADLSEPADAVKLAAVPGVNNTYVALKTPDDFTSGLQDNWVLPQMVPQANGLPSSGYAVRLYNGDPNAGGTEILTTDGTTGAGQSKSVGWFWDYASGLLLLADDFSPTIGPDLYVNGFVYIGLTVSDLPTTVSGGGTSNFPHEFDASCPAAVSLDDLVYVTGASSGGFIPVDTVDVTDRSKMPAIGIVVEKITTTRCRVVTLGEVVPSTALTPGRRYFTGASGQPSLIIPTPLLHAEAFLQPIGYALDTNRLLMLPDLKPGIRRG